MSSEFYQKDTQALHNFFDIDRNNQCTEQEFMTQLLKGERLWNAHKDRLEGGRPGTAGTLRSIRINDEREGMNAFVPGFNESSPRTQGEKLTDYLANELRMKNIQPVRIFSMADTRRQGNVKFG